jgi:hypothetical protein
MTNNSQVQTKAEYALLLEEKYKNLIKKEGVYEPEWKTEKYDEYKPFKSLRYLIENDLVAKDEDGDWYLVQYSFGFTNTEEYFHWKKTGYQRVWSIYKWKPDTDLDEDDTSYLFESKNGCSRKHLKVKLNKHYYSKHTYSDDGYWSETIQRIGVDDGFGGGQLYYKDSLNITSGKMPVKIGKKIQELKDKKIEFGFYKF